MHQWLTDASLPEARMTLARLEDSTEVREAATQPCVPVSDAVAMRVAQSRALLYGGLTAAAIAAATAAARAMAPGASEVLTLLLVVVSSVAAVLLAVGVVATLQRRGAPVVARVVCVVERELESNSAGWGWFRIGREDRFLVRVEERTGRRRRRSVSREFFESAAPGTFLLLHEHAGAVVGHRRLGAMTDPLGPLAPRGVLPAVEG